jgi:putative SOS response-associated peptidase YedK
VYFELQAAFPINEVIMCGRFSLVADLSEMQAAFPGFDFPFQLNPRFNIAPSQPVLAIPNTPDRAAAFFKWGLIPTWAKDPSIGIKMINARSEGLSEKPSFRGPLKYKRCLVLASGFYEWKAEPNSKQKTPYYIQLASGELFAIAGLWDEWMSSDGGEIRTCTLITTQPNSMMAALHNRMPIILPPESYEAWLNPTPQQPAALEKFLAPYDSAKMTAYPVSTLVNSPQFDSPQCIVSVLE